jgi:hypothetical protein
MLDRRSSFSCTLLIINKKQILNHLILLPWLSVSSQEKSSVLGKPFVIHDGPGCPDGWESSLRP